MRWMNLEQSKLSQKEKDKYHSRDITLPTKVCLVKAMVFPVVMLDCGHMWELDYEESWALKNWCFWTVVLEKTLESSLDCKEIQPVHSKGDQPWVFFGRNDAKAETPVLWPPHAESWFIGKDSDAGKDWGQEEKRTTEDEMAGWHHWPSLTRWTWTWMNSRRWWWTGRPGMLWFMELQESDTTEQLNWTELNAYMQNLEKWYWRIYLQGSNGETDIENRPMDLRRGKERVRCMGILTWTLTLLYVR